MTLTARTPGPAGRALDRARRACERSPMPVRPTEAVVDLAAIASNYRYASELAGRPPIGVVKADAYGHGAVRVARALSAAGCPMLGVALVEEGMELREAGLATPILVFGGAYGGRYDLLVRHGLTPFVFTDEHLEGLAAAARSAGRSVPAHLKLDTGMGRLGLAPEGLPRFLERARSLPEVRLEGLCTHLASADAEPRETTDAQVRAFDGAARAMTAAGFPLRFRHLANSAGTIDHPAARQDLARPGIMLYGYLPHAPEAPPPTPAAAEAARRLRAGLTWRTAVAHVKTVAAGSRISYGGHWTAHRASRVATLPVGYADGYSRRLSGRAGFGCGEVLVRGRRAPVTGTVCMDMVMIDVTDVPGVEVGDEVVLVGTQGAERIGADELAARAGTIPYEVLCGISARVPRRYT
jgi:alanine racemase